MWKTPVTQRLDIELPIIQAPMGGGPTTAELVVAVSNAGGLGSVAGGYLSPDQLHSEIVDVRRGTVRPFAVNVFASHGSSDEPQLIADALATLRPLYEEVGYVEVGFYERPPVASPPTPVDPEKQIEVLLALRPPVVSFTFGVLPPDAITALQQAGCVLVGTATSVAEALHLEDAGVDMVCAQGAEAGAHRGTFLGDPDRSLVGLVALVPQVRDAVEVPVIAAGGLMDGRGVAAALALGAGAAQMGTAFLRTPEAATSKPHRRALAESSDTATVITAAVTGKHARGLTNRLIETLTDTPGPGYPTMNDLTAPLRRRATELDAPDLMSLWAGQGAPLGLEMRAADLVRFVGWHARDVIRTAGAASVASERTASGPP